MPYSLLDGLKVLELGGSFSAPYCGKLLADMGAQVIKIKTPGIGGSSRQYGPLLNDEPHRERSGLYLYLNSNKKGITLNLETPTGRSILRDLVSQADALVHNLPVAAMEQLGVEYSQLSQTNPSLIMATITFFGLDGPYRDYKAYDINLAAGGGICEGLGEEGREPLTFGTPEVGYFSGLAAASSLVLALLAREDIGGQHIDIAEVESLAGIYDGPEALMAVYQWRVTRRTGHHALDFPYLNCVLRCKDGYVLVGAPEGRQWRQLLELMGNPEWSQDPRFANRTEMNTSTPTNWMDTWGSGWATSPKRSCWRGDRSLACPGLDRGLTLWVPAFAGTTGVMPRAFLPRKIWYDSCCGGFPKKCPSDRG